MLQFFKIAPIWILGFLTSVLLLSWQEDKSLWSDWSDPVFISFLYGFGASTLVSLVFATFMKYFEFLAPPAFAIYHLVSSRQVGDSDPVTVFMPLLGILLSFVLFWISNMVLLRHKKALEENEGAGYDSKTVWEEN